MAPTGDWKLRTGNSKAQGAIKWASRGLRPQPSQMFASARSPTTRTLKGQGATEYMLILGVLLLIAVVASSLLGFLPGVSGDAKKETYIAQLRAGEPFSIEDHNSVGGKLSISFANKKGNELNLTHVLLGSEDIDLTQSTGGLSEFSGGMRRVLTFDVPCIDGVKEFEVILVYVEDGVQKEEKLDGKIVVESCTKDVVCSAVVGEACSVDGDCCAGTCVGGTCKQDGPGTCDSDEDCESGNCNPFTHFCDPRPNETCSPSCMLEDASIVCGETIAGAECSGWEDANPQCSVLPNCGGRYSECSLLCGGVCAGWLEECGGGVPCCGEFECSNGFCIQPPGEPVPVCGGTYGACNATTCCANNYCNATVSGECQICLTSGLCNATTVGNCCSGYACSTGYSALDVPRIGTWCGLPDGSSCTAGSQCVNGTCYEEVCKNCNTNNVCDPDNGNDDCCFGKLCLANQTGNYTCQNAVNVSGAYEYLYDTTWSMMGSNAVIYKVYSNGTSVEARVFGQKAGVACTANEECLSNSCVGNICVAQSAGSWCSCTGSGYSTCDSSSACPSGLVCNPYNYTCVSTLSVPAANYGYLCKNSTLCYQQCYNEPLVNFYTYCNQIHNVCEKGGQPCLQGVPYGGDAQCCSNSCVAGMCAAQSSGSWCQISTYSPDWPFGVPSTVSDPCVLPLLSCVWNTSSTPFCQ